MFDFGYLINIECARGSDVAAAIRDQEEITRAARELGFSAIGISERRATGASVFLPSVPLLSRLIPHGEGMLFAHTVLTAAFHQPFLLAEHAAFLDAATRGNFALGLAAGWGASQFGPLGFPDSGRVSRLEETVEILRLLWRSEDPVSFAGTHFSLTDATLSLRPVQNGGPPLWIGASAEASVRRAARIGDSWIGSAHFPIDRVAELWNEYRAELVAMGLEVPKVQPRVRTVFVTAEPGLAERAAHSLTAGYTPSRDNQLLSVISEDPSSASTKAAMARVTVGHPAHVASELASFVAESGATLLFLRSQAPGIDAKEVIRSLELFAQEVAPEVNRRLQARRTAPHVESVGVNEAES